jgi:Spy/CpxP family protein refolding chaperone
MSFIRIAVAGLALCASASVASAQGHGGHDGHQPAKPAASGGHQGRGHGMMLKGITLTADQQAKLDALMAKHHTEREAAAPSGSRPDSAARAKMRVEMEKHYAEIRDLLTPDQQKVFDANIAEMKQRREKRQSLQPRT